MKMLEYCIDLSATGENIKRLRQHAGLSVKELTELIGISSIQAVYRWERGEALPSIDNLMILSTIFNTPLDEIIVRRHFK